MNIVFFSPTLNVGGYEKVVLEFANYLINNDNRVTIVCCNSQGEIKHLLDNRIHVIDFNCKTRHLLGKFVRFIRNEKPDIFYTGFRIYNSLAVIAKYLSGSKKTKICISQHGFEMNNQILKYVYGLILNRADLLIGVTESLRVFEIQQLGLKCKSVVIGNPVIKNKTECSHDSFDSANHKIVTCGRLSEDKNYMLALYILKEVIDRGIEAELVILGDGPERGRLERMAEEMKIKKNVSFIGYVTNPIDYMKGCSVYLHTCDREGFGNTVVEAMYAGLPVVTTDCGGPVDLIENGRYGKVFGNGRNADAPCKGAEAIISVFNNPDKYHRQKTKAMQFVIDKVGKKIQKEFEEIL